MLKLLLGDPNTRKLKRYQPIVEEINFLEDEVSRLSDDELRVLAEYKAEKFKNYMRPLFDATQITNEITIKIGE